MASAEDDRTEGLLTQVCLTCGNEYTYADAVPEHLVCGRCGGTVFRSYFSPSPGDTVAEDQLESTRREIEWGGGSTDVAPDDIADLNNP